MKCLERKSRIKEKDFNLYFQQFEGVDVNLREESMTLIYQQQTDASSNSQVFNTPPITTDENILKQGENSENINGDTTTIHQVANGNFEECPQNNSADKYKKLNFKEKIRQLRSKKQMALLVENHQEEVTNIESENTKGVNEYYLHCAVKCVGQDVVNFFNKDNKEENDILLRQAIGNKTDRFYAINTCMEKFMEQDIQFSNLEIDENFVSKIKELGEISRLTDGMRELLYNFSDDLDGFGPDYLNKVQEQLKVTQQLTEYYYLRMDIISDELYQKSLYKNILHEYHRDDSKEKRNLAVKLLKLDNLINCSEYLVKFKDTGFLDNKEMETKTEKKQKVKIREKIKDYHLEANGIDNVNIEGLPNKEIFLSYIEAFNKVQNLNQLIKEKTRGFEEEEKDPDQENELNPEIYELQNKLIKAKDAKEFKDYERLAGKEYFVTGKENKKTSILFPKLACLSRLTAVKSMNSKSIKSMIGNLAAYPHENDPFVMSEIMSKNNLDGLLQYKKIIGHQAEYLFHKYGTGLETIEPEKISNYKNDFESDFSNFSGLFETIEYMMNIPQVFNKKSKDDLRIYNLMSYYNTIMKRINLNRALYCNNTIKNESEYFKKTLIRNSEQMYIERKATLGISKNINWKAEYKNDYRTKEEIKKSETDKDSMANWVGKKN